MIHSPLGLQTPGADLPAPSFAPGAPGRPFVAPTFILGVDPGLSGALAFYEPETGDLVVVDTPILTIKEGGKLKSKPDVYALGILLDHWRPLIKYAVVEKVSAMPEQGVTSSFNFGDVFGVVRGAIAANIIPMHMIQAREWKGVMKLPGGKANKDESRALASKLMPRHAGRWNLKKHDGRAEAALLAWYGHKYLKL